MFTISCGLRARVPLWWPVLKVCEMTMLISVSFRVSHLTSECSFIVFRHLWHISLLQLSTFDCQTTLLLMEHFVLMYFISFEVFLITLRLVFLMLLLTLKSHYLPKLMTRLVQPSTQLRLMHWRYAFMEGCALLFIVTSLYSLVE